MPLPRSMGRQLYIPARDCRHRIAVFGLYRALLRSADRIALPAGEFSTTLSHIIRKQFRRNGYEVSSRLVFAALTAGYKSLSFLNVAQDSKSLEYNQLITSLRNRETRIATGRSRQSNKKMPVSQKTPVSEKTQESEQSQAARKIPMLVKVSGPGEHPQYTASRPPLPAESLKGQRVVPMVAKTSEGQPFLRLPKFKQPHAMSRSIGQKTKWYVKNVQKIVQIDDETGQDALDEDKWEQVVEQQKRREGLSTREFSNNHEHTFSWSVQLSRLWWEWKVNSIWQDWIARGEALQKIVDSERELADKEQGKYREVPEPSLTEANVVARVPRIMPPPPSSVPNWPPAQSKVSFTDPFLTDEWQQVIKSASWQMAKHTKEAVNTATADLEEAKKADA